MKAWRLEGPGSPEAFQLIERKTPKPKPGWVVIEIDAFGLNRSELFSRRGLSSPDFEFPRVLGLECTGRILNASDTDFETGDRVIAMMGGMGRGFDGSYATHTVVPRSQVFRAPAGLSIEVLGAVPETYNTATAVCFDNLKLGGGETVLVRGGTSALGMAAISIAKDLDCTVVATSRSDAKGQVLLEKSKLDHLVVEGDGFVERVHDAVGNVDAVFECVGSKATMETSAATMREGGRLGQVGQLAETWSRDEAPDLPPNVTTEFTRSDLTKAPDHDGRVGTFLRRVEEGRYAPNIHRVFSFDELPEAHRVMENNEAVGKLVVRTK